MSFASEWTALTKRAGPCKSGPLCILFGVSFLSAGERNVRISHGCSPPRSHVRECLKLDQDDKECFGHYKQVKKLSKQLDSAEELIEQDRSVPLLGSLLFTAARYLRQ